MYHLILCLFIIQICSSDVVLLNLPTIFFRNVDIIKFEPERMESVSFTKIWLIWACIACLIVKSRAVAIAHIYTLVIHIRNAMRALHRCWFFLKQCISLSVRGKFFVSHINRYGFINWPDLKKVVAACYGKHNSHKI